MKINKLYTLGFSLFLLLTLLVVSCSKEENLKTPFDENTIAKRLKFIDLTKSIDQNLTSRGGDVIIVEWSEWGRASKNCGGWGLCNADWFPSNTQKTSTKNNNNKGSSALLKFDNNINKYYIDILLAETVPTDIPKDALTLKIDLDFKINLKKSIGHNLTFHKGSYYFDNSLGDYGGYRIYID